MVQPIGNAASRPFGRSPAGAFNPVPPRRLLRRPDDGDLPGFGQQQVKHVRPAELFRFRHIPRAVDERRKIGIRYGVGRHAERLDAHPSGKPFGIGREPFLIIGAKPIFALRNDGP